MSWKNIENQLQKVLSNVRVYMRCYEQRFEVLSIKIKLSIQLNTNWLRTTSIAWDPHTKNQKKKTETSAHMTEGSQTHSCMIDKPKQAHSHCCTFGLRIQCFSYNTQ